MSNEIKKSCKVALVVGGVFALLSVAVGAFAAHGLKSILSAYQLGIFETAARYQMYHALALILTGFLGMQTTIKLTVTNTAFIGGIVCFSGSLYLLALLEIRWLAFITPIGGVLLLVGWLAFLIQAARASRINHER